MCVWGGGGGGRGGEGEGRRGVKRKRHVKGCPASHH